MWQEDMIRKEPSTQPRAWQKHRLNTSTQKVKVKKINVCDKTLDQRPQSEMSEIKRSENDLDVGHV